MIACSLSYIINVMKMWKVYSVSTIGCFWRGMIFKYTLGWEYKEVNQT